MARQIRKKSGTGIYHIMLRGIPLMIQSQLWGLDCANCLD